jgi:ACS family hexuronate transporter-like MFS transporter
LNLRWVAVAVFALASTWNYLDRLLLAAAAPAIRAEFHLSNEDYGWLLSAFALSYALASPVIGWFLDRLGLELGIVLAVGLWSVAAALAGWSRSFLQLLGARSFLGIWESAGVPAAGKLNAVYLEPKNRALGAAMTQVGLSIGGVAAPLLVAYFADWRTPFFLCAGLGILWIPLWIFVRRRIPAWEEIPQQKNRTQSLAILKDSRLFRLAVANLLWMGIYTLWSNWTTIFLKQTYGMTAAEANHFAWFPPVASTLGAFAGGWLSMSLMSRGGQAVRARVTCTLVSAVGCLVTIAAPHAPSPLWATLIIAMSYFWVTAGSVNLYTIPVDIWGGANAGTAISALVFAYGLLQMLISPRIGALVDHFGGFHQVCWLVALPPLVGWLILRTLVPNSAEQASL